ncbi:MAG: hypothetical protein C0501_31840, partial [Isosphaera sp.]|nr:hypothetical protein [Isosphaera sp.]
MRRVSALLLAGSVAGCLALAAPARPQDPGDLERHYRPHRTFGIPVSAETIAGLKNKPSELQLYYAVNRSAFQKSKRLKVSELDPLEGGRNGFLFTADRDGDYEFTVQFVYPDGSVSPKADELSPQVRTVVDTTPPVVKAVAAGTGVQWRATDDNLDPRGVKLQIKWPHIQKWTDVTDREFRPADAYSWTLAPGKALDVRVVAADRAGNEGVSAPVRVPGDGQAVGLPKGPSAVPPVTADPALPAARVDYVNTLKFDVDSTVRGMGRSGVQAAHLFVIRSQGGWEKVKRFPLNPVLTPGGDKEPTVSLPYEVREDGTYGFYVIPESGAGKRADDPKRDDPPMVHVVVDTVPPYVQVTGVQVRRGAGRNPVVEITWKAADPNLMPDPINLEWSPDPRAGTWNEIKYRLRNFPGTETGRYAWEVPDENLWKFYVRARAVDKASNTGEHVWGVDAAGKSPPAEVIVDLETPAATINRVRPGG